MQLTGKNAAWFILLSCCQTAVAFDSNVADFSVSEYSNVVKSKFAAALRKHHRDNPEGGNTDPWNIESPEGGSIKTGKWDKDKGGGPVAYFFAVAFIFCVGLLPLFLHMFGKGALTKTAILECCALYLWLLSGVYLFTQVLLFNSGHFSEPRSLRIEEAVYLMAQIITTVGYGDITPAKPRGQVFVGFFVFLAICIIANMVSELMDVITTRVEDELVRRGLSMKESDIMEQRGWAKVQASLKPVLWSGLTFFVFVAVGTCFFHLYPGEGKTVGQGVYMSLITLSSVGFGAFTPVTHGGMVFAAYWMLFGVTALGSFITSATAFSVALKEYERCKIKHGMGQASPAASPRTESS